jgi:hypothetical protein
VSTSSSLINFVQWEKLPCHEIMYDQLDAHIAYIHAKCKIYSALKINLSETMINIELLYFCFAKVQTEGLTGHIEFREGTRSNFSVDVMETALNGGAKKVPKLLLLP